MSSGAKKHGDRHSPKNKTSGTDELQGDQIGGDKITIGNISDSQGVAIGRGASVEIRQGAGAGELAELFSTIYQKIESRPAHALVEKEEISDQVKRIETEVASGEKAEPAKVERWLRSLALMAPDILDVTLGALTSPIAGISIAIQKIAQKMREDMR